MYKLGLDIGITSVGWAVLNTDINGEPNRIIDLGVRIFDAAEHPKDGASLAAPRREARSARRRNRRKNHRKERIKALLQKSDIIDKNALENLYHPKAGSAKLSDIYMVRYEALNRLLTNEELARLLIHFSQRRGFKSNRKSDNEGDNGLLLKATSENLKYLNKKGYQTVGEMLYKDEKYSDHKRNKSGSYENTFLRRQIEDEVKLIFACQKSLGNKYITDDFAIKYMEILFSQRDFSEGPGAGSPYGGDQIMDKVGDCTFEKGEKRAAKATYTFELFNLWHKINAIKIISYGNKRELTKEEKLIIESLCHKSDSVDYKKIRKALDLDSNRIFNLSYGDKEIAEVEKAKFNYLPAYHTMRKRFDSLAKGYFDKNINTEKRDVIGTALTYYKSDNKIREYINSHINPEDMFSAEEMDIILNINNFSKVGNLSLKAIKKIMPFLMDGMTYDKACAEAGYDFKGEEIAEKKKYLPKLPENTYDITNPVVKRAINQTIKVVNAVIKKYGSPASINIELSREMHKNRKDRDKIKKEQDSNAENNQKVYNEIRDTFKILSPTGQDIIKYRLWKEQGERCIYSGYPIEAEKLFLPGYYEIDHIIPYSISFDDTYNNKVLVIARENRNKGNRLPLQYISDKDNFRVRVINTIKNKSKRDKLLKEYLSEDDMSAMKDRNLTDTQFITTFVYNYIRTNLLFDENYQGNKKITAVNGKVTSYMRKRWGINKIRENGDLHHCIDAAVVACITDGMIRRITNYSQWLENRYLNIDSAYMKTKFPPPWDLFRDELDIRTSANPQQLLTDKPLPNYRDVDISSIKPVFVSRMTKKKLTGAAHKATIKGYREIDGEMKTVSKTPLKNLKLDKNNEIAGYYNEDSDRLLYNLLRDKLIAAGGNGEKAFPEGFVYKPTPKGGVAPKVRTVKIFEKASLVVPVNKDAENGGVAGNGDMVRIDLYKVEGDGYYFVPVYVSDLVKDELPCKASVRAKSYDNWKEMKEEDFLYSIYPNDLLKITHKKDMKFSLVQKGATGEKEMLTKETFVYYKQSGIATASIRIITHDNRYSIENLGVKTVKSIEKYHVDILGNIYKAPLEKRGK